MPPGHPAVEPVGLEHPVHRVDPGPLAVGRLPPVEPADGRGASHRARPVPGGQRDRLVPEEQRRPAAGLPLRRSASPRGQRHVIHRRTCHVRPLPRPDVQHAPVPHEQPTLRSATIVPKGVTRFGADMRTGSSKGVTTSVHPWRKARAFGGGDAISAPSATAQPRPARGNPPRRIALGDWHGPRAEGCGLLQDRRGGGSSQPSPRRRPSPPPRPAGVAHTVVSRISAGCCFRRSRKNPSPA